MYSFLQTICASHQRFDGALSSAEEIGLHKTVLILGVGGLCSELHGHLLKRVKQAELGS